MKGKRSWSWSNPATARYFPQSQVLPDLSFTNASYGGLGDLAGQQTAWYADLADALSTNGSLNPPHGQGSATQLGWARPLGSPTGGAGGGAGVQYIEGERAVASGSVDGYRYLELSHRLHLERMPNVIWDRAGFPSSQDSFLIPCPGCPVNLYPLGPSGEPSYTSVIYNMDTGFYDASFCPSPGWAQNQSVVLLGQRPDYETSPSNQHNLLSFEPHDRAHLVRFLRLPLALAWLGNDPVAKDDLRAMAEMFRFTYTEYGNLNGAGAATSLHTDASFVAVNPEWGYMTGRGDAWGLDAASAAYALSDDAFRARLRPWCSRVIDLFEAGLARAQDPNYLDPTGAPYQWGVLSAFQSSKFFGTGPSDPRGRQTWEEMLLQNAMLAMLDSVLTESEPEAARLHDVYRRSALGLVSPVCWNEAQRYIHETVPVSGATYTPPPHNVYECDPTFGSCAGAKALPAGGPFAFGRDDHYTWPALAQSYVRTQDTLFLHRLSGVLTGQPCPPGQCVTTMLSALNQTLDPTDPSDYSGISNRAALLGVLQNE